MCRLMGFSMGGQAEELDASEIAGVMFPALVGNGPHAYGWMTYNAEDKAISFEKHPGRCDTDEAHAIIWDHVDPNAKWFVGHTRFATHGSPEDNRNNHPLSHGNIIGVHNGVLRNHEAILRLTGREDPKTEVDSEAIFAAVNKWGHQPGLRRVIGDMVTIYADFRYPETIRIGRSKGRQITLGWSEKGNLFWASEQQALEALEPEITFEKFSVVSENRLLVIRNGKIADRHTFKKVDKGDAFKPVPRGVVRRSFSTPPRLLRNDSFSVPPEGLTASEIDALVLRYQAQARTQERRNQGSKDAFAARDASRASARGKILFPEPEDEPVIVHREDVKVSPPMGKKQRQRAKRAQAARRSAEQAQDQNLAREISSLDDPLFDPGVAYGD